MTDKNVREFLPAMDGLKIVLALALQAAALIWYIATATATINTRLDNDERRISAIEQFDQQMNQTQNAISDRLARVEEKTQDELETSRRIEIMVQGMIRKSK